MQAIKAQDGEVYAAPRGSGRIDAMPRAAQVPDIRKVDLPEARQAIPYVHAYLRECILDGTLSPGTKLSHVSLAAQLGISRTPLREGRTPAAGRGRRPGWRLTWSARRSGC